MLFLSRFLLIPVWVMAYIRIKATQEATLLWTLAVGVEKQFPLVPFLEAMADEAKGAWRWKVRGLAELLAAEMSIPDALEAVPALLSADTLALIRVGARTGNLSGALREGARLARVRSEDQQVNIHGSLFYLSGLIFALASIGGFIMYYIIPKYKAIFEGFNVRMPALTQAMINVGGAGGDYWFAIVILVPLMLIGTWVALGFCLDLLGMGPSWGKKPYALSLRISPRLKTPPLLRCLAVCIDGGRPLTLALDTLSRSHPDVSFRRRLVQISDNVARGDECWLALRASGMLRPGEPALLEAAQRVGNLPWALRGIADAIERRSLYRFHIAAQFLDPALTLAAGAVIGLFCASMFLPLIELLNQLS